MKILLAIMQHEYGDKQRGPSYEFVNFYKVLRSQGYDVELFDYMEELARLGRESMNAALIERAATIRPDVAIFSLYTDQILPGTIDHLNKITKTFCFFHDDTWRVEFSEFWAKRFNYFSSADTDATNRYARLGLTNVFYFPFGVNEAVYRPTGVQRDIPVSFVGAWHPLRAWLISRIRRAGINVVAAGHGWKRGTVTHEEMVDLFNRSRINLNLSNSSSWDVRYLLASPRGAIAKLRATKTREQMKARPFEINACGGFQLSYYVNGLERCYRIGEEIGVYLDPDDMLDKVRFYLEDDDLRERIANAGLERTRADHTYSARFRDLFKFMGVRGASE